MKILKSLLSIAFLFTSMPSTAEGQMTKANGLDMWYETFGDKENPPLLLVAGGLCQGILWPAGFCERMVEEGFYVIRYDNRDTGFTTCFDYAKDPYTLEDMAKDGIGLLDALEIEKAHLCGLSMGGPISELMSVNFPGRILTMTIIASSPDFRPSTLAFDGIYPDDITLPRPTETYTNWMHEFLRSPPKSFDEQLEQRVNCWRILSGSVIPFEEDLYRKIHGEFLRRIRHQESLTNHLLAIKASFDLIQTVPHQVKVPTLIIHGSEDPLFPPPHGIALHKAITHSRLVFLYGLGHVLNGHFHDTIATEIKKITRVNHD